MNEIVKCVSNRGDVKITKRCEKAIETVAKRPLLFGTRGDKKYLEKLGNTFGFVRYDTGEGTRDTARIKDER